MGFRDLFLFYVVTGISLRWIASAAAAGPSSLVIWLGAWLLFYVPLALSVIALASRYPDEGGLYVWSKHAFGDFPGFLCGWIYWCSYFPYLPAALYFAAGNALYIRHGAWGHLSQHPAYYVGFSLATLVVLTLLNLVGLTAVRWLHDAGALAMWVPAAIIFAMGVIAWRHFGAPNSFDFHSMIPATGLKDMMFWAILIFAFAGCETASFMGAEIKGTAKTLPLALLAGGATVALCYILGTLGILLALPAGEVSNLQGLMQAVTRTADRVGLSGIVPVTAALISLSGIAAVSAFLAATTRLPFVAGMDRVLPPAFASLHPRWRTPWVALLVESGVGVVFLLLGQFQDSVKGAYDVLVSIGVITYFIPYGFLFAAAFKLAGGRRLQRFLALVGMLTTGSAIVLSLLPNPAAAHKLLTLAKVAGSTAVLAGVGAWIYWKGKTRMARAEV
jgi:amino acid transporter